MNTITYCLGDIFAKRRFFRDQGRAEDALSVDNEDVAVSFRLDGSCYCVVASLPFGTLTVGQYVRYHNALSLSRMLTDREVNRMLARTMPRPISLCSRVNRLDRLDFKALVIATKLEPNHRTIYLNCDGIEYSRRNRIALARLVAMVSGLANLFVSVGDYRFVPQGAIVRMFEDAGVESRAVKLARRAIKAKLAASGLRLNPSDIKSIVCQT